MQETLSSFIVTCLVHAFLRDAVVKCTFSQPKWERGLLLHVIFHLGGHAFHHLGRRFQTDNVKIVETWEKVTKWNKTENDVYDVSLSLETWS